MNTGKFIVVEGIDGAGTTTVGRSLTFFIEEELRRPAIFTAEPTDGPVGKLLRAYLKGEHPSHTLTPSEHRLFMSLLFCADRQDHLANVVYPALGDGKVVVCDRYSLSTFAYQGERSNEDLLGVLDDQFKKPDLMIFLRASPSVALARLKERSSTPEIYEDAATVHKVASAYDRYVTMLADRFPVFTVNADKPLLNVQEEAYKLVTRFLQRDELG